ncbi:hypothetical protein MBLNU230_g2202t1 [Neophaeotheca triangularis]
MKSRTVDSVDCQTSKTKPDATAGRTEGQPIELYPTKPLNTHPFKPFDYADCEIDELKKFVHDRKLTMDGYKRPDKKSVLVRRLIQADKQPAPFPFFRLPPELRNSIYENVLTFTGGNKREKPRCHPQILYTCKQAAEEAAQILYHENDMTIKIPRRPKANLAFPPCLHYLNHLTVYSNYEMDPSPWSHEPISTAKRLENFLKKLSKHLAEAHVLKSLTIHVDEDRLGNGDALKLAVVPVRALGSIATFKLIHDALPAEAVEYARKEVVAFARSVIPSHCSASGARTIALRKLLKEVTGEGSVSRFVGSVSNVDEFVERQNKFFALERHFMEVVERLGGWKDGDGVFDVAVKETVAASEAGKVGRGPFGQ